MNSNEMFGVNLYSLCMKNFDSDMLLTINNKSSKQSRRRQTQKTF